MPGASWRNAFISRSTPLVRVADPISTGQTRPSRSSLARSSNTLSRGGWISSSNCSISSSSWSASVSSMEKRAVFSRSSASPSSGMTSDLSVLLVDEGALEREIDEAGDELAREGRDLPQQQLVARRRLQQREHVVDGRIGLVDLVDEQEARNVLLLELAQDELQLRDLLLVQLADHDRRVDGGQRRAHVVDEFDRAGTIDEGVAVAHEIGGGDGNLHAHAVMAGFLAAVADRGPRIHRALAPDHAGAGEDRFEQRRLAALERAHQRNAPWTRSSCAVLCHTRLPCSPETRPSWNRVGRTTIVSGNGGDWQEASVYGAPRSATALIQP